MTYLYCSPNTTQNFINQILEKVVKFAISNYGFMFVESGVGIRPAHSNYTGWLDFGILCFGIV